MKIKKYEGIKFTQFNSSISYFKTRSNISKMHSVWHKHHKRYRKCVTTPSIKLWWKGNGVPTITKMKQLFLFHHKSTEVFLHIYNTFYDVDLYRILWSPKYWSNPGEIKANNFLFLLWFVTRGNFELRCILIRESEDAKPRLGWFRPKILALFSGAFPPCGY